MKNNFNTFFKYIYRFGNNIGEVTQDTFETVGHGLRFTKTVKELGPKQIFKTTIKETGRNLNVPDND